MEITFYMLLVLFIGSPSVALFLPLVFKENKEISSARVASFLLGIAFIASVFLLISPLHHVILIRLFFIRLTMLNSLLCTLILLVSFIIHRYSIRYMAGDRFYRRYFFMLSAITLSLMSWVLSDNVFIFFAGWSLSTIFLVVLMTHKNHWEAAKQSGWLALKTLMPGLFSLLLALALLSFVNESTSIETITRSPHPNSSVQTLSLILILFTSLTQSALWPFHRWLLSSLNSPTPVSALMHAGLINGGGILMITFSPLFSSHENLLTILFLFGAISAFLGNLWKLVQYDVKRMLACSTMAQMGFMMMQCGLGLFSAALIHLCWHGLFKAYLFLTSGSAIAQAKSEHAAKTSVLFPLLLSTAGGLLAMYAFAYITNKPIFSLEPTAFLLAFAFIAGAQITLTTQNHMNSFKSCFLALPIAFLAGVLYGGSIYLIGSILPHSNTTYITHLNSFHIMTIALFIIAWFAFNFGLFKAIQESPVGGRLYMMILNQSQPHPKSITAIRQTYQF